MNSKFPKSVYFTLLIAAIVKILVFNPGCVSKEQYARPIIPPGAEKIPKQLTIHGDTRIDPYYWFNERDNPKVHEYLISENAYRDTIMKQSQELQKNLYNEIINRIKQEDKSVPYLDNGYYYYWRYDKGQEYRIYARKKGNLDAAEEIMLHIPRMAQGYSFYSVRGLSVSEDNHYLAFGVDTLSRRKYTIHFRDLLAGRYLSDRLSNTTGQAVWANDNKTVFYVTKDSTLRAHKVMKHILGTDPVQDEQIYHEKDSTFSIYIDKTKTDKYILLISEQTLSTEIKLIDADRPDEPYFVFQEREKDHEYYIYNHINKFYVLTNWNAKNFRLMETQIGKTDKRFWKEIISHRDDVLLENINVFKNYLVLNERKEGIRQIRIINLNDQSDHYLKFNEEVYVAYPSDNYRFDTSLLRFEYSSLTTPTSTYDYDMVSHEKTLLKIEDVGGGFESENYQSRRLWATARDGIKVPISLVYRTGFIEDGQSPLLLYGYGSYGSSRDPYFNSTILSLLDRGFIYAIAHVRGGSEMGRYWYENGKLLKKKNTFTDFIDCAEFLIARKYTNPDMLFVKGGSAGGLLIGAVVNMRPDLFKGVIANVPWVDVVTTMLDESIPLTTSEFDEWGDPKEKEYYEYMLSYSPYDNVTVKNYPAMYVTTGFYDSQVQYFEPAKWVAKLRNLKTDNNLIILDVDFESGHGGASGRFKRHERTAMEFTFILNLIDINNEK